MRPIPEEMKRPRPQDQSVTIHAERVKWLAPHEVRARPDVERNLREGRVHAKLTARSYDQSCIGFDGMALLDLIDRSRLDAERLRIQGSEVDDETRHHWQISLLGRLSAIEIGVTRLMGIPCEFGRYSPRNNPSAHSLFRPIRPLKARHRAACENQPMPVENRAALMALVLKWQQSASSQLQCAERTKDPMGKRLVQHGGMCYFNCAQALMAWLDASSLRPSPIREER